ncbi:exodeoxyribonuclease V subunit alpha [Chlamydia pecorum]|uniref:exodeoxyribonuclease V subunit alpha n=1 Tax=Chlamydia pecorum TaxID=85991 RepID=UPI0007AF0DBF|nr:exodeoxyribonuclease V subunit alpha [Chlamydia pecorum]KZN27466.1 exodeoxyribonuclease V, alpha subunit [Chlamydia pecorum]
MIESSPKIPDVLKDLLQQHVVSPLDVVFARRHTPPNTEKAMLFLAASSALWRHGYPFLCLLEDRLVPSVPGLSEQVFFQGFQEFSENSSEELFVVAEKKLYLRSLYETRKKLFQKLTRVSLAQPMFPSLKHLPKELSQAQAHTLQQVSQRCFSIVCGGPGTGKTFLAIQLIVALINENPHMRIIVVSPTGKVAAHFRKVLANYSLPDTAIAVHTIHHFLQEYAHQQYSTMDVLIVDEGSMVDFHLLHSLVQTLPGRYTPCGKVLSASMIIFGDKNQLPPIGIGAGNPLQDLIKTFPESTMHLEVSYRAKTQDIQEIAQAILSHQMVPFSPLPPFSVAIELFADAFQRALSRGVSLCVLSPMRLGVWGYVNLNRFIHHELQKRNPLLPVPIIVSNRYETWGLCNGDTGVLSVQQQKLMFSQEIVIDAQAFSNYTYNYAMSVHKSQGSEYDEVLVVVPKGCEIFESSLLYTAVTRAKSKLSIWADAETLTKIIKKPRKYSFQGLDKALALMKT